MAKGYYKGRRTGGHLVPIVPEKIIQPAIVGLLDWCQAGGHLIFTHIPHGGKRDPATASQLKHQGVRAGWPDIVIILADGRVVFWEIKKIDGALSEPQPGFI